MSKTDVIRQAKKDGQQAHVATLMDLCHLKNQERPRSSRNAQDESCSEAQKEQWPQRHSVEMYLRGC